VTVVALVRDLLLATRIGDAAVKAGRTFLRLDEPDALPPPTSVELLIVDWGDRGRDWGARIAAWRTAAPESARPRLVLFGPHVDREAHAAARAAGLGPMVARSKLVADLAALVAGRRPA
jgi:hypothetical protein